MEEKSVRRRIYFPWILILIALLILLWYLANLDLARDRDITVNCTFAEGRGGGESVETTRYQLKRQVILTGPESSVLQVIDELPQRDERLVLELVKSCDLSNIGRVAQIRGRDTNFFPFSPSQSGELVTQLYEVPDHQLIADVLREVSAIGRERAVFADPNYLTGLLAQSSCSNPFSVGGSPFSVGGSPFSVGGSPSGSAVFAPADAFWNQWAFEHIAAGPAMADALAGTEIAASGNGVLVGVFDTSPYQEPPSTENGTPKTFSEIDPALTLTVFHPGIPNITAASSPSVNDVGDHGVFVSGLIHAVAPESEIHLIQVLNNHGCGDLFTLNEALFRFIAKAEGIRENLDGVVLNLSLGILKPGPLDEIEPLLSSDSPEQGAIVQLDEATRVLAEDPIESLRAAVYLAHQRGAVIVAAAGNDSYLTGKPLPPQIPASYPFVIGVSATNIYRERSCFANWGDVTAPGGEGISGAGANGACGSISSACGDPCNEGIISLSTSSPTMFVYWSGTSFSTPMVSGLASLVLDAGVFGSAWMPPNQVYDAVRCGSPTGDGVINVPATLFRCIP